MKLAYILTLLCVNVLVVVIADDSIVNIDSGPIRGIIGPDSRSFLGIPFAAPPVGELRWADPAPVKPWGPSVLNTLTFSAGCPQRCQLPPHTCPDTQSEDCLYLNVYTPRNAGSELLPVFVFVPGGRFEQGAAGTTLYNGTYMANVSNTIVVTTNYRLGVLGFLYNDNMGTNFGFKDQIFALQWVQRNIKAFGGDPERVTLGGQSAGGTSTSCHLSSPKSLGLFHQAIIQSNPLALPIKDVSGAKTLAKLFAANISCSETDTACFRRASIEQILDGQSHAQNHVPILHPLQAFLPWTPTIDGTWIVGQPVDLLAAGNYTAMPVMIGTVNNEALMFVYSAWSNNVSRLEYEGIIFGVFHLSGFSVLDMYPSSGDGDHKPMLSTMGTDYMFACASRKAAYGMTAHAPTFLYHFDHALSFPAWGPEYAYCEGVVCHGAEMPFVFHSHAPYDWEPQEAVLSQQMTAYWSNFAHSGNPNTPGLSVPVQWPEVSQAQNGDALFAIPTAMETNYLKSFCDEWDKLGYNF